MRRCQGNDWHDWREPRQATEGRCENREWWSAEPDVGRVAGMRAYHDTGRKPMLRGWISHEALHAIRADPILQHCCYCGDEGLSVTGYCLRMERVISDGIWWVIKAD